MKVLLGVTGGIAAYKALELVRLFVKAGHEVQVVMTEGAKAFIQPLSFQALSGHPVRDQLFDETQEAGMGHIELARWPDVILVAPCSAETLAKFRMGRADDLLTTLCLASDKPKMLAPAMNRLMWQNEATQENLAVLQQRGWQVIPPGEGEQACGETGAGRLPEPPAIYVAVEQQIADITKNAQAWVELAKHWQGKRLLVSAGPTQEAMDPVRFLGNRSSGKMGFAIAETARKLGAVVTLVAGPVALSAHPEIRRVDVVSAQEMLAAVTEQVKQQDVFISAAAVADFRPETAHDRKLKKQAGQDDMTLRLVKNPDIVATVAQQYPDVFVVGFAAETDDVLAHAREKRARKGLDMICANRVGDGLGFETDDNQLTLMTEAQERALTPSSKSQQAFELLAFIAETSF
ncbi:bifunctional phosphopantothenoylcysteine decarboxylase/phosphopantothenate--cysteine ligase CoaBC [Hydrogenovibrio thermophilus]|uniref:Coenzyme A biosynthesis bifunctional protein CoaBC n=1 Tax=Hydrogenovibrio thermophilus TaxID=265883 RepID=A0A410H5A4_9GAMM|nr:bifunctional phosphopantothenoylcysteine decarboxylase/phosphopantothenate--cysteine ligase CoaBC [Hydrogenovibrio thermophilus]QAB16077.1 bifunctional phosphopantothenoylcysteine decarboxylase/phosphopantothenate--cysteine ligase CoaBC [Hydrogenovibrio thermophilus]